MDQNLADALKTDFKKWSGGFPPESDYQITVYIDYAAPNDTDAEEVRGLMRTWMNSDDE